MKSAAPAIFLIVLSVLVSILATARTNESDAQVAVLFPLNSSLTENINAAIMAETLVVRVGMLDKILIVKKQSPNSIKKLYNLGALAVFNPAIIGECVAFSPLRNPL